MRLLILISALLSFVLASGSFAQSSSDDDIHISAIAEFYALHTYSQLKGHKALAVGPGGYWSPSFGKTSAAAASKAALTGCNGALRTSPYKQLAKRKCVLFDINGKRTGKATATGIPFGVVAGGPDLPYASGSVWEATGTTRRGTLLLLHGCNKLNGVSGWLRAWINFYRASGFRVVFPNSFAEPRDPEMCGNPGATGIDAQTRNIKLRVAQTLRTLATLRQRFPGEAIYVHGHSEGGYVAQALGETAEGIIVTGAPCGFGDAAAYWVGKGTPLLVIAGTKDPYIPRARSARELSSYCKTVRGDGKLTTASVTGMGHATALWWPGVRDAIGKFLGITPIVIMRSEATDVAFPAISAVDLEEYDRLAKPKAIAAAKTGEWFWDDGADTRLDAEESALFGCDDLARVDAFEDPQHKHGCVLVDVNGKRLAK